ncbi:helix-turn-helix domain-containing protein [Thermomonospora umbrina]|uniref:Helix-turn-helix protein n=1 Tax=Thermomonospora umbrina TaxID=111806 RepID=A0A3D9SJ91_9ACTN|nr:helix-turn-helix transcriptional regulator [Thermomonospora umbrina]REE95976.1 helix-turn-helix protein [Thermomonospora umbrina]
MSDSRHVSLTPFQEMFVYELRARREKAGLSRNKLAEALGCTPQWIAKVETFEKSPSEGLADDLDTFFKCDGAFRRIWEKHTEARKRGLVPSGFRPLTEAEQGVSQLSLFAPLLVPGLFQTEECARMVFSAEHRVEEVEERVALRMGRQTVFTKSPPPWFFLLIREPVLRDLPAEIRKGQCRLLLDRMGESHISIQLIPTTARVFQEGGFQLLNFDEGADLLYVDGAGGCVQVISESSKVRGHTVLFNVIRSAALSVEETESRIRSIMEGE